VFKSLADPINSKAVAWFKCISTDSLMLLLLYELSAPHLQAIFTILWTVLYIRCHQKRTVWFQLSSGHETTMRTTTKQSKKTETRLKKQQQNTRGSTHTASGEVEMKESV
jgi:hypothetical protein